MKAMREVDEAAGPAATSATNADDVVVTRFRNREEARRTFDPHLVDRLEAGLTQSDVVGDAIALAIRGIPDAMRRIDAWLTDGSELPPMLAELLEPIAVVPEWVDWDRVNRGAVAYWRGGVWMGVALKCAALAAGYRSSAAVKPLILTGRLVNMAERRSQETARWSLAATTPGGLERFGDGFRATVHVRIVHSVVRRRLASMERWQLEDWGVPINLTDTAYGIAGEFSTVPVGALRDIGIRFTQAERDDIQHLWRYVGWILGVPEELLPLDEADALEICAVKDLTDTPPDEDSRKLLTALIEHGRPPELKLPRLVAKYIEPQFIPALYGFTRRWAGDEVADQLGVPDTRYKHLGGVIRPAVRLSEFIRGISGSTGEERAARVRGRIAEALEKGDAPEGIVSTTEVVETIPAR